MDKGSKSPGTMFFFFIRAPRILGLGVRGPHPSRRRPRQGPGPSPRILGFEGVGVWGVLGLGV